MVLKEWLGHTDIHITLDTYADVFNSLHNDSIGKYEEYLDSLNKYMNPERESNHCAPGFVVYPPL